MRDELSVTEISKRGILPGVAERGRGAAAGMMAHDFLVFFLATAS